MCRLSWPLQYYLSTRILLASFIQVVDKPTQADSSEDMLQVRVLPEGAFQVPESSKKPIQGRLEKPLVSGSSNQSWTSRVSTALSQSQSSSQYPPCVVYWALSAHIRILEA